ncbi:hypothetical protein L1987_37846 [Smallanthus sonchifolius]|uniref:Uncharacterized protein n=1 Tax=Smallanthus sonchifolius TaxID=185202 RepID=A0ACB9HHV8_9ASTR|nr:hypothetical protein L1987_37846 [Smallanthus sonchifolius]
MAINGLAIAAIIAIFNMTIGRCFTPFLASTFIVFVYRLCRCTCYSIDPFQPMLHLTSPIPAISEIFSRIQTASEMPVFASAVYFLNLCGDVLINRLYRDHVGSMLSLSLLLTCDDNFFVVSEVEKGLVFVVVEARRFGIRLILNMVNNYENLDGKKQYVNWARNQGKYLTSNDDFFANPITKGF